MPYARDTDATAIPLLPVPAGGLDAFLKRSPARHADWARANGFEAKPGKWCALPGTDGGVQAVAFGMQSEGWLYQLADLPTSLPPGRYRLDGDWLPEQRAQAALGWGLASYRFDRYLAKTRPRALLELDGETADDVEALCAAQTLVRDLVNTPTEDLGPEQLADAIAAEADRFGAELDMIVGDDLLTHGFPAVHAVGRAAATPPRLATLKWGREDLPLLALVGKGVCFDSGGLDIKNAAGMSLMKKDMGGAAHALALARLVMYHGLPVRLLVVIPAVENAISGNAYRPGDVVRTRAGLSVEIGNTDAEGRVILSDALDFAGEQEPDLLLDFATLTGAARVAMGPDVPPIFSNRRDIARGLMAAGEEVEDPVWELPLFPPYRKLIESDIADLSNIGKGSYGGCITAALFLQSFVPGETPWVHFDTFAWNLSSRPGRPVGGEALGLRAAWSFLRRRYA